MNRARTLLLTGLVGLAACSRPPLPAKDVVQPAPEPTAAPAAAPATTPAAPASPGVTILAPAAGTSLPAGQPVTVMFQAQGQPEAVVVYVDHDPPKVADLAKGLVIPKLPAGQHVLRAVPVTQGQLSKEAGKLAVVPFFVGPASNASGFDPQGAILTLGQPADPLTLPASGEVPMDVRLDQLVLSEAGWRLKYKVDAGAAQWLAQYPPATPLTLGRLEPGPHKLTVWIEDPTGKKLDNAGYAAETRSFTVPKAAPAPAATPAPPPPAPAPAPAPTPAPAPGVTP